MRSNIFDLLNNPLIHQTIVNMKLVIPDCLKEKISIEREKKEKEKDEEIKKIKEEKEKNEKEKNETIKKKN
jgi:hypothetical protein